jgi:hypothetical protein
MSHHHFTLSFPLKSPADAALLMELLPPLMPDCFEAQDRIGTIHYSRFTLLGDKTLLFLGDFDGEFGPLMADLAEFAGPLFDLIVGHMTNPPPTPVAGNVIPFVEWSAEHLLQTVTLYSAYPDATVEDIRAMKLAVAQGGAGELQPLLVTLPAKSRLAFFELQVLLRARSGAIAKGLDRVHTAHFAQFVALEENKIGFFTVYDGNLDAHITDVINGIGPIFDLLFNFVDAAPPSPCREHPREFLEFAARASRHSFGFYQAYPGLGVQDIRGLLAGRTAESDPE